MGQLHVKKLIHSKDKAEYIHFLIKDGMVVDTSKNRTIDPCYHVFVFRESLKNIFQPKWYENNIQRVRHQINILSNLPNQNGDRDLLVNEIKRCLNMLENNIQIYFCLKIIQKLPLNYNFNNELYNLQLKNPPFYKFTTLLLQNRNQ